MDEELIELHHLVRRLNAFREKLVRRAVARDYRVTEDERTEVREICAALMTMAIVHPD